jgi:hypothetical protein
MIKRHKSGSKEIMSTAGKRRTTLTSCGCDVSAARWFRCGIAVLVLLVVAAIFIAPSIDLPDGVLRDHAMVAQTNASHAFGEVVFLLEPDSFVTLRARGEIRTAENRPPSNREYADQRPHLLRC